MKIHDLCLKCGQMLPEDAPGGVCPACLLALVSDGNDGFRTTQCAAGQTPSSACVGDMGRRFGDYELLEEIARGGMGVVYKARQLSLHRTVALKLILSGQFAGKEVVRRFRTEAGAAAILQHPNIVAVHDVGVQEGQHFFSMDYVHGQNLAQLVGNRPIPPQRAARYVKQIAEAIHYAHGQGILHRDLKPSNVLIETATDQPRVTDFGLAKRFGVPPSGGSGPAETGTPNDSLTVTGQILGSPNFMPPEQAGSGWGKVGRHSDVYSLGGILYYLLSARAPFESDSLEAVVTQVLNAEPIALRLLNPSVSRDLETVCLKCLEKEPQRRYPSAQALAEDLERFLGGQAVFARPVGRLGKLIRVSRRHPRLATITVLALMLFGMGLMGILVQWRRATDGEANARQNSYAADMLLAQEAVDSGHHGRAVELLQRWQPARRGAQPDWRGWEWHYLWRQCQSDEQTTLGSHSSPISALVFYPAGDRLASASVDGAIKLWDFERRAVIATGQHPSGVYTMTLSPDVQWLATGGHNSGARLWRADSLEEEPLSAAPDKVMTVHFARPDGRLFAAGLEQLTVWKLVPETLPEPTVLDGGWNNAFSREGRWVASGRLRGSILLTDLAKEGVTLTLNGHAGGVFDLDFSPDHRWLASGSADKTARIWDLRTGSESAVLRGHRSSVNGVAFSPDGQQLATASTDQTIRLWEVASRRESSTLRGHRNKVQALDYSPDGLHLASGDYDGVIKLWATAPRIAETNRLIIPANVKLFLTTPDLSTLGGFTPDGRLLEWDLHQSQPAVREFSLHRRGSVAASRDGRYRALELSEGVLRVCDSNWNEIVNLQGAKTSVRGWEFSPNGEILAVGRTSSVMEFWKIPEGQLIETGQRHPAQMSALFAFSSDGQNLVVGYNDGKAELWRGRSAHEVTLWAPHSIQVTAMAFSRNNKILATAGRDGFVRLWKIPGLELLTALTGSTADMPALAFTPDGQRLAVGTHEGQVTLWDLSIHREVLTVEGHLDPQIVGVGFTPDGKTMISASRRDVIFWRTDGGK